ncbi:MAG TPA: rhomboid family intramembrane serine protease [Actinomycetota bacterium]|nr:rhomboid family intramembrane serine protease [Actinomycetota bacterium]
MQTRVHCTRCGRPICPDCMIPAPVGHQCPVCVEEARREFRGGSGRGLRTGGITATKALLFAIAVPFVLEVALGGPGAFVEAPSTGRLVDMGALQPLLIAHGQYWRLFTAMFLHAGLFHIAFNAYALWLFGMFVEFSFGRTRFLLIYFVSGFLASVASFVWGSPGAVGVGASGAIFGIFGAFIAYNYRRRHLAMASANLRWAIMLLLLNAFLAFSFRAIDWRAHLGGLVAGVLAGLVAEGVGAGRQRQLVRVAGFVALIGLGAVLVVWRTEQLRASAFYQAVFGG